jgi:hypothetical protein
MWAAGFACIYHVIAMEDEADNSRTAAMLKKQKEPRQTVEPGLCGNCRNARIMTSDRGSVFYRCLLAEKNDRFTKYPHLPVMRCDGWER